MAIENNRLFTPAAMGAVDRAAIENGIDGPGLMERAGAAVAACALEHWPAMTRAVILCGPGNNGGDGHVAARHLSETGVPVARYGMLPKDGTDAAWAYASFSGAVEPLADYRPERGDLVIDALFGAGLDRAVSDEVASVIERVATACVPVLAVDLPSGLSGHTGRPTGVCFTAERTVTFAALKTGHVLLPGRDLCGRLEVADIGIPTRLLRSGDTVFLNAPSLYAAEIPAPSGASHKYARGHLVVFSGPMISSGAARMSAMAGLRSGAGLVTVASPPGAVMAQSAHLTAVMQRSLADGHALAEWLEDKRLSAFVLGPGFGHPETARAHAEAVLRAGRALVLDADGLTAFGEAVGDLASFEAPLVLTPHEGEFRRLFPDLLADAALSKIDRARRGAERTGAVVVYKGADTVIASPDGRAAVNCDAPAKLATAGSGDVLAGIIGSFLARGVPVFEAACAGVALHSEAARRAPEHMTAEDLIAAI
ncbi:MAG: bifunctional ADP-dependent NAD(P)H-hydrate dehydratase/NAD(P)H-hydrate epimerase [Rhizobiales bacterium]|nr:bifunctional ADP-dependent NAD(P)H-hydrate dehydratase/NAD(P)H-hydrate epimerase [Hyphomicrobiales bacterium]MBG18529.1 bifunctional ADP-dependent NAD(P)H-hydrate dehydratase/NAD(P)H-hydrate epimerase [Hyphomicrobiales bacterium]